MRSFSQTSLRAEIYDFFEGGSILVKHIGMDRVIMEEIVWEVQGKRK
jgi:hypothetical protein